MITKRRLIGSLAVICWLVMGGNGKSFGQPVPDPLDPLTSQFVEYVNYMGRHESLKSALAGELKSSVGSLLGRPTQNMADRILQAMREGNKGASFLWLAFVEQARADSRVFRLSATSFSLGEEVDVFAGAVADALFYMMREERLQGVQWCLKFLDRIMAPFYPGNYHKFQRIKQNLSLTTGHQFFEEALLDNIEWTIRLLSELEKKRNAADDIYRIRICFKSTNWDGADLSHLRPQTRWNLLCDIFNACKGLMRDYRSPNLLKKIGAAAVRAWAWVRNIGKRAPK